MKHFMIFADEVLDDYALLVSVVPCDDFRNGDIELETPIEGVEITNDALRTLGVRLIEMAYDAA